MQKSVLSSIAKHIHDIIKMTGPISVSTFMRQALIGQQGYYMKGNVFGSKGDFITSPEISQLFGEMIGIWCFTQYRNMKSPSSFQLIELGPGRGTLMYDILSTFSKLNMKSKCHVHLIEPSLNLQSIQKQTFENMKSRLNIDFNWHTHLDLVPDSPSLFIAHEFFDALPIYKFQKDKDTWKEIMVDLDTSDSLNHFRYVLTPIPTTHCISLVSSDTKLSSRFDPDKFKQGDTIEVKLKVDINKVCPEAWSCAKEISDRIGYAGGAGLFIDYGSSHIPKNSFRGIKNHEFISPLESVGDADITADVDFSLLKDACEESTDVFGPIQQNEFLESMGILKRLNELLKKNTNVQYQNQIVSECNRLMDVGDSGMGKVYKVMAIQNKSMSHPFGFNQEKLE